ncbi:TRAP transporter small permease subunit [Chloroflexota bacterium]
MEDFTSSTEANLEHTVEGWGGDSHQAASPPSKKSWLDIIDKISTYTGEYLSWLVVLITAIYCAEVFLRSVFNAPTIWAHESSTYLFGLYFMLGGAYALRMGKMVNVDIWVKRLSPRTRCMVDGIMSIITFIFLFVLIYKGAELSYASVLKNETSQTVWSPPIYPLKITAFIGAALMCLQALSLTIRNFIFAIRGGAKP